jgi:hypothetical protein
VRLAVETTSGPYPILGSSVSCIEPSAPASRVSISAAIYFNSFLVTKALC